MKMYRILGIALLMSGIVHAKAVIINNSNKVLYYVMGCSVGLAGTISGRIQVNESHEITPAQFQRACSSTRDRQFAIFAVKNPKNENNKYINRDRVGNGILTLDTTITIDKNLKMTQETK